jgi:1-acyl-sn-glycerol-3-phosphate acyltransferase
VVFGALFSLALISLIKGSVSVIAIAAGSIVMGIAVNYSLHYFVHLRHTANIRDTIRDLAKPMTVGSATTVLAFLGLQFVNASLLKDVGLFAGFSLIGAMLFSLIFLPHFFPATLFRKEPGIVEKGIEKLGFRDTKHSNYIVALIFILTPLFFYYAGQVKFNSDMNKLNFMSDDLKQAQKELNEINQFAFRSVFLVTEGNTREDALQKNEQLFPVLKNLQNSGLVKKISSVSNFILSDSLQKSRINRWNNYWDENKRASVVNLIKQESSKLGFRAEAFQPAFDLLQRRYTTLDNRKTDEMQTTFFADNFAEQPGRVSIITFVQVDQQEKNKLYDALAGMNKVVAVDNEILTTMLVEYVNEDFNFILTFTSLLVFFALLVSYGRIELTLITFIPMLITWIWILGIMALLNIEFNIVNVMISTFIFGLGDDYSIFIMDGLQQKYRSNKNNLISIRTSVILSALTTISGLGVLIFAQHPALKSIALISIIGIVCVVIMSQTIEPFLFRFFIANRAGKKFPPMTFFGLLKTLFAFSYYVFGALLLTIIGFITNLIPIGRKKLKYLYHVLIRLATVSLVYIMVNVKKRVLRNNHDFKEASIIIANHSSFCDIISTAMLHPKLILLTNKWVWNSPVFGRVVRFADYYPVMWGTEEGIEKLKARLAEGYSVIIFPEGTRSYDGKIHRFHKGAFYLSEHLKIPITPLVIHGMNTTIQKGDFYLQDSSYTLKFLPKIYPDDSDFGTGYKERARKISKYFKSEFQAMRAEYETPGYFRYKLISNYLFKGPVLEWYLKIKLRLEKNYQPFESIVPKKSSITDLGCGYGFLCYMLHFLSEERTITGIDYDEDKIETAKNCYSRTEKLNFVYADIVEHELEKSDVIILSDVLHYLNPDQQEKVIQKSVQALNPEGMIILREGITDAGERYRGTKLSEFFSVKIMKFNKSTQSLNFMTGEKIRAEAAKHNLEIEVIDDAKFTSNVIFVLRMK